MPTIAPPTIVVDTREQQPYSFDAARAATLKRALPAGDYSLLGAEAAVAVERKSLDDFVHTVIRGRKRFGRVLRLLSSYQAGCVVVEADLGDLLAGKYTGNASPSAVWGSVLSMIVDYRVPVFFCSNRQVARLFVEDYLLRFHRSLHHA